MNEGDGWFGNEKQTGSVAKSDECGLKRGRTTRGQLDFLFEAIKFNLSLGAIRPKESAERLPELAES